MPETCENLPGLLNNGVYFARQTCKIYQVLPYMMRSSNGTIFRVTGPFVTGEFPSQRPVTRSFGVFRVTGPFVTGEFPSQRPVTRSFGVFFDLRLNKQFSKQS